jgi:hypothetical protein
LLQLLRKKVFNFRIIDETAMNNAIISLGGWTTILNHVLILTNNMSIANYEKL